MASNLGNIKALHYRNTKKEKLLKPRIARDGYYRVHLTKDGKDKTIILHRLIAMTFLPNPNNLPQVNHKNEIKTDNNIENLE